MNKKKSSSSKKILTAAIILTVFLMGGILSIIYVLAATQQNVTSSIKVSYTVDGIAAQVSSNYAIVPNDITQTITRVPMLCETDESTEFLVDDDEKEVTFEQQEDTIELLSTAKKVVYEFHIKNLAESMFVIKLNNEIVPDNMVVSYKTSRRRLDTSEYRQSFSNSVFYNLPILDTQNNDREVYIYMSVEVENLNKNADYEGNLNWTLKYVAEDAPNLKTVTLNNDGATGPTEMKILTTYQDETYAMPMLYELPEKNGYVFTGYYSESEFANQYIDKYGSSDRICGLSDGANLYAKIEEVFMLNGSRTTIEKVNDCAKELPLLTVPASVTEISSNAFEDCSQLVEVDFESTDSRAYSTSALTTIGANAFKGCTKLEVVHVPDTLTTLGAGAFDGCISLTELTIPTAVTSDNAIANYFGTTQLKGTYKVSNHYIPNSLKKLNILSGQVVATYSSYYRNYKFTEIDLLSGVTAVANNAFSNCSQLRTLFISDTVQTIGSHIFFGCSDLRTVNIDENNQEFYFAEGIMFDKAATRAMFALKTITSATLPNTVLSIEDYAFYGCRNLQTISMQNVTSIGESAFQDCSALTEITIPEDVTSVGSYVFRGCTRLETVNIEGSTSIGQYAFQNCTGLKTVNITGATNIGQYAFQACSALYTLIITGETIIGPNVFQYCGRLYTVDLTGVTSIGNNAFQSCTNLQTISMPNVTSIGKSAFMGCSSLRGITIPNGVTSIEQSTFQSCTNLLSALMPNVTSIGDSAFQSCTNLQSVSMPNVMRIGMYAFANCGFESLIMADSVINILPCAFQGCTRLLSITISKNTEYLGTELLEGCMSLQQISIPLRNEIRSIFGGHSEDVPITLKTVNITYLSSGILSDDEFRYCSYIESITLPDTTTKIDSDAFRDCSALNSLTILSSSITFDVSSIKNCSHIYGTSSNPRISFAGTMDKFNTSGTSSKNIYVQCSDGVKTIGKACLVEGTKIMLANGTTKNIEDLTYGDLLLTRDLINGGFSYQYPIFINPEVSASEYIKITFNDGTILKVANDHGFYDVDKRLFVNLTDSVNRLEVGSHVYRLVDATSENPTMKVVSVESIENVYEEVKYYHVESSINYNVFAENILVGSPEIFITNLYGQLNEDVSFNKEVRENALKEHGLLEYELQKDEIPYYIYLGYREGEAKHIMVEYGLSLEEWFALLRRGIGNLYKYAELEQVLIDDEMKNVWVVSTSDEWENLFDESYQKTKVVEGEEFVLPEAVKVEGKTFVGWKSSADGKIYEAGDSVVIWFATHFEAIYE